MRKERKENVQFLPVYSIGSTFRLKRHEIVPCVLGGNSAHLAGKKGN